MRAVGTLAGMNQAVPADADSVDLNQGWAFIQRRASRRWLSGDGDKRESIVDLPHCWNAADDFQEGVAYYRGPGSYRKTFSLGPARSESQLYFETEGFYGLGDLWVNGRCVASIDGQYLGVSIDVTDAVRYDGDNTIGVRLTNRCGRKALPGIALPDFLLYGGLSGRAKLVWQPRLRFERGGVSVITRDVMGPSSHADVDLYAENASDRLRRCVTEWRVLDAEGNEQASAHGPELGIQPGERSRTAVRLTVPDARLWSPGTPVLYTMEGRVIEDGREVDRMRIRFGFREVEFRPRQGCFVNGVRAPLRGCNRHECQPGYGRALPLAIHAEDAARIRGMGLNFVRLSHYPQHPAFLDACDEQGLLVYAEIASWKSVRGGRWIDLAERQMRGMIRRDRNHPSIILWGLGNEGRHRQAFERLQSCARELDPDRPTIYAENHLYRARRKGTLGIPDVWGTNYELDALEAGCEASRLKNVVISECCNYPHAERGNAEAETLQVAMIADMLERIRGKDWVAGFALWSYNDYGTLRKRRYRRHCGLVDAWRRPKMAAEYLRTLYAGDDSG